MSMRDVAGIVVAVAPIMQRYLDLEKEVQDLRFKHNPPLPDLDRLLEGTPLQLKQDRDGQWSYTLNLGPDYTTGGSGLPDARTAFVQAIQNVREHCVNFRRQYEEEDE